MASSEQVAIPEDLVEVIECHGPPDILIKVKSVDSNSTRIYRVHYEKMKKSPFFEALMSEKVFAKKGGPDGKEQDRIDQGARGHGGIVDDLFTEKELDLHGINIALVPWQPKGQDDTGKDPSSEDSTDVNYREQLPQVGHAAWEAVLRWLYISAEPPKNISRRKTIEIFKLAEALELVDLAYAVI